MKKLTPARVISPSKILKREIYARNLTKEKLAEMSNISEQTINDIITEKKEITPEIAIKLSQALNISAQFWLNLEANYRLHLAQKKNKVNFSVVN